MQEAAAPRDYSSHPHGPSLHAGDELPSAHLAAMPLPDPQNTHNSCQCPHSVPRRGNNPVEQAPHLWRLELQCPGLEEGVHLEFPFPALSLGRRTSISGCEAFLGTAQQPELTFPAQKQIFCGVSFLFPTPASLPFCTGAFCCPARTRQCQGGAQGQQGMVATTQRPAQDKPRIHISLLCDSPPRLVISTLST